MKTFKEQIAMSVGGGAVAGMPTASPPEQTPVPAGVTTTGRRKRSPIVTDLLRRKKPVDMIKGLINRATR